MFWLVMGRRWRENTRFRRALLGSLALHGLAALFVPTLAPVAGPSPETLETISYERVQHVALQARAARPHTQAPPTFKKAAVTPHVLRHRAAAPARKAAASRPQPHATAPPTPGATVATRAFSEGASHATPLPATPAPVAVARTAAPASAMPLASPAAAPQRRAVPNAAGASARSGLGLFGEVQDPSLAKPVMDELLRRFRLNLTLIVTVGDDGRTKQIEFHPPVTSQLENQIRTLLADANWDPALCGGGIACEGKATIKL